LAGLIKAGFEIQKNHRTESTVGTEVCSRRIARREFGVWDSVLEIPSARRNVVDVKVFVRHAGITMKTATVRDLRRRGKVD